MNKQSISKKSKHESAMSKKRVQQNKGMEKEAIQMYDCNTFLLSKFLYIGHTFSSISYLFRVTHFSLEFAFSCCSTSDNVQ